MKHAYINLQGRLGDILFIYCYARAWCEQNDYHLTMHPWLGERIFNIPETPRPNQVGIDYTIPEWYYQEQKSLIYTRKQVREWLQFRPEVLEKLRCLDANPPEIVCNRRVAKDWQDGGFVCLSRQCYIDAVRRFGYDPTVIFWEEDITQTRLPDFGGDDWGLGYNWTAVGVPGFYRLMTAPILFRSTSPYGWWAATLNTGKVYAPVLEGLPGGVADTYCPKFVPGNWPTMMTCDRSDLHLPEG